MLKLFAVIGILLVLPFGASGGGENAGSDAVEWRVAGGKPQGDWFAGFTLFDTGDAFTFGLDLLHLAEDDTGQGDITISLGAHRAACSGMTHTAFCAELRNLSERGFVRATVQGVRVVPDDFDGDVYVAFRLPGDYRDRLLWLSMEPQYYSAAILHPDRGYDFVGFAKRGPHLCEQTHCAADVFNELRDHPQRFYGSLADTRWADAMRQLPNRIVASHQHERPQPIQPSVLGAWRIVEETGEPLGFVTFAANRTGKISARGNLLGVFRNGDPAETQFRLVQDSGEALAFEVIAFADGAGEQIGGRLSISRSDTAPQGSLRIADDVFVVDLIRAETGASSPRAAPEDLWDNPGINVYKYAYRLRNVPAGRNLVLRQGPSRDTGISFSLPPDATELQIDQCMPEIDSIEFEHASLAMQMDMLSRSWCKLATPLGTGWLPGSFLDPIIR